MRPDKSI